MQQLSGLDASFLSFETGNSPMHIAGVCLYDTSTATAPVTFDTYRDLVIRRLHVARTFRQRLVTVPLGLDRPYWVEDPDFDIDYHLRHLALPKPGGWAELSAMTARLLSRPLDRTKPLWEMNFVEGLDSIPGLPPGSFATITKVHHAAIDGVSGAEMLAALLDITPEVRVVPEDKPWKPERIPTDREMLMRTLGGTLTSPVKFAGLLRDTLGSGVKFGTELAKHRMKAPPVPFTAPRTRFNLPVSGARSWGGVMIDLDRVKRIKNAVEGATVNDAILAIVSGGLRRYLQRHKDLPKESLVAFAPISVRPGEQKRAMGNQISGMMVRLSTEEKNPVKRLSKIHDDAVQSKDYHRAVGASSLMNLSDFIPFAVAGLGARLYTGMEAAKRHNPVFNVVVTNVPGPQFPLYSGGAKLVTQFGAGPVFDGLGLIIPIFSYNGTITVSATACRSLMPDMDAFMDDLRESVDELDKAASAVKPAKRKPAPAKAAKPKGRASKTAGATAA